MEHGDEAVQRKADYFGNGRLVPETFGPYPGRSSEVVAGGKRNKMINEGIIDIDSDSAKQLGFTSDRFLHGSYLWRVGNTIIISVIIAKQKGMFCQLIKAIQEKGFDFEIPTPSRRMQEIGKKQNWTFCEKEDELFGVVEILTNRKKEIDNG
ncbi:MAG: hypothetical protein LBH43_01420 [Treponema sp.]|nr:hypothetical protein [Treponema sp.]